MNIHPDYEPHRGIAASTGYRGVQSTPLVGGTTSKPLGMLSTLFRKPYQPSKRELRLTDLYAQPAADVITVIEWRSKTVPNPRVGGSIPPLATVPYYQGLIRF
ncbi:MAG: hypothetical protein WB586_21575 [Chthoniobacterales bacterium]